MATRAELYVTAVREANTAAWDAINKLVALQREWNALDYGTTLPETIGAYERAALGAVVFDTANALVATLNAGHATNMAKLL